MGGLPVKFLLLILLLNTLRSDSEMSLHAYLTTIDNPFHSVVEDHYLWDTAGCRGVSIPRAKLGTSLHPEDRYNPGLRSSGSRDQYRLQYVGFSPGQAAY